MIRASAARGARNWATSIPVPRFEGNPHPPPDDWPHPRLIQIKQSGEAATRFLLVAGEGSRRAFQA